MNQDKSKAALCSWSGGKDSCFAWIKAVQNGIRPAVLLNVLNEEGKISRSHGIPRVMLEAQAAAMDLPIHTISSSWTDYEKIFTDALRELKARYLLDCAVFGDIDLQPHRDWEEKVCAAAGLEAVLPLWKSSRKELVLAMLDEGIDTIIVSCNEQMGKEFLGRQLTRELVSELEEMGIDPCGENGEYHSFVQNCRLFSEPVIARQAEKILHEHYWFLRIEPAE